MGEAELAIAPVSRCARRLPMCTAGTAGALLIVCSACTSSLTPPTPIVEIPHFSLDGRGRHDVRVTLPADTVTRIVVTSRHVDVRLSVTDSAGDTLAVADAPQRRLGQETVLLPASAQPMLYTLVFEGNDQRGARGDISVRIDALPARTTADRRRIEATTLDAAACVAFADTERNADAADGFERAAALHQSSGDVRAAGIARLHAAGVQYDRLTDWTRAATLAAQASENLDSSNAGVLAAYARRVEGAALSAAAENLDDAKARARLVSSARTALGDAATRLAALGEPYEAGYAYSYRGISYHDAGERDRATGDYRRALALFVKAGDAPAQALPRQSLAQLAYEDGRLSEASREFAAALALIPRQEQPANYAHTLHNSALPLAALGRFDEAIARYHEASIILREVGDASGEARALHGIATALRRAGEPERARPLLESAIRLRAATGSKREQAVSLTVLGEIELDLGRPDAAIALQKQALALVSSTNDRARALLALAEAYRAAGEHPAAVAALREVVALDLPPTQRHQGNAWSALGSLAAEEGRYVEAEADFERALAAHRASGSELEQARTLAARAEARAMQGNADAVLADTALALDLFDRVGLLGTHGETRAAFLASQRNVAERRIATLLGLAARATDPAKAQAYRWDAFATSDRVRARLLDEAVVHGTADHERLATLYETLSGKRARRDRQLDAAEPDARELERLATEIELTRAEIAATGRVAGSANQGTRLQPPADRRLVTSSGTVLAEWFVGQRRAWRFELRGESVAVHELGSVQVLQRDARALARSWRSPSPSAAGDADGQRLARRVFASFDVSTGPRELVLVPDGALHIVPMAVLAERALGRLDGASIVVAPSARAWLASPHDDAAPRRLLAIVADPVFTRDDPRLRPSAGPSAVRTAALEAAPTVLTRGSRSLADLRRLPASAVEAREIAELAADPASTLALVGSDATIERFTQAPPGEFRILHFATHAWADAEDPSLATLALSAWDARGRPVEGRLRAYDIANLSLDADLVVLSACETGLGREIRGEAPVSLSHAFLRAGARSVLSTLWAVPDTSTAALMREFYRHLLKDDASPAQALRLAQDHVRSQSKWADPYFWAGFQLTAMQGQT